MLSTLQPELGNGTLMRETCFLARVQTNWIKGNKLTGTQSRLESNRDQARGKNKGRCGDPGVLSTGHTVPRGSLSELPPVFFAADGESRREKCLPGKRSGRVAASVSEPDFAMLATVCSIRLQVASVAPGLTRSSAHPRHAIYRRWCRTDLLEALIPHSRIWFCSSLPTPNLACQLAWAGYMDIDSMGSFDSSKPWSTINCDNIIRQRCRCSFVLVRG